MKILKLAILLTALGSPGIVNAALVSADWQTTGDNLITRDDASGLDWLNLTASISLSYNGVLAEQAAGGQFDGWRHASPVEVITLLSSNFGIDLLDGNVTIGSPPPAGLAQATTLLGDTLAPFGANFTGLSGVTNQANADSNSHLVVGADYLFSSQTFFRRIDPNLNTHYLFDLALTETTGHWLVAATPWAPALAAVPVPAALWLFGTALVGLYGFGMRIT